MEDKLKKVINEMLKENTGKHYLDSGGVGGRAWEQNQPREFEKEDAFFTHVRANEDGTMTEFWVTFNLYHFLTAHLMLDETTEEWQKKFDKFATLPEWERESWEDVMEAFCKKYKIEVTDSYYTYNTETILSQDIIVFEINTPYREYDLIFLRIHGGCDARGGFTAPKIFRKCDHFDYAINSAYANCSGKSEPVEAGVDGLIDLPEVHCGHCWDFNGEWYSSDSFTPEFFATVRYDEETKKFFCRDCGGEVMFSVEESW